MRGPRAPADGAGPIVREVWRGSIADAGGVVPGDIVVSVNARPVEGPADLRPMVADADTPVVEVVRGGKRLTIALGGSSPAAGQVAVQTSSTGIGWTGRTAGVRIEEVGPDSAAAAAGIGVGDYLQRVGDVAPRNLDHARRLLDDPRSGPLFVVLENSDRRYGVLLKRGTR
ncbi:MAG: PDZ domain-containing protein [Vicinamibacterales bacterium]